MRTLKVSCGAHEDVFELLSQCGQIVSVLGAQFKLAAVYSILGEDAGVGYQHDDGLRRLGFYRIEGRAKFGG